MKNKMLKNIKSVISSILVLLVVLLNFSFVPAVYATGPTLTIGSQTALNGANITVPISASNFSNSIAGMTFNVQYDPTLLTYTGYTENAISGHGTLAVSDPATKPIAINWFGPALSVDSGTIITLNFTVISASITTANLTFGGAKELSDSSDVIGSTFADGVITLNPAVAVASVANLTDLQAALADTGITTINITENISGIPEELIVGHAVTINGGGKTLTFTSALNALADGHRDGIFVSANGTTINNLSVVMAGTPNHWDGVYGIQFYGVTGGVVNNYTGTGADAALLINGSAVELTGVTTVSGNDFGGIEVSKGTPPEASALTVTGTLVNGTEAYGKPTIWLVNDQGSVTGANVPATTSTTIAAGQTQYYLTAGNAVNPASIANVADLTQLTAALADSTKTTINITANISAIPATLVVPVGHAVTINGGGKTLTFTGLENVIGSVDDGFMIQAPTTINDLTVDAGLVTPTSWVGTYAIQVYNTTATLNNVTAKNGNGGILNNNSTTTLTGAINVSGNGVGGIESSGASASLNVSGVSWTNSSEAYGLPTVWEDGVSGTTVINYGAFTRITKGGQYQYYLTAGNAVDPAATLATAKVTAHDALTTALGTYTQANYTAENWTTLTGFKTEGDTAINAAGTTGDVTTAQNTATAGMAGVVTDLADAKTAALTDLSTAFGGYSSDSYEPADWTTLTGFNSAGITAINGAVDLTIVASAKTTAINGMDAVVTITETLVAAKTTAHDALTTALGTYTETNYTADNWTALTGFKTTGDTNIDAATNLAGVTSAQNTATTQMAGVKTIAQTDAEALVAAKTSAHDALTTALGTYTQANYTTGNWTTLTGFKTAGDTTIDVATDLDGVISAQNTATNGMAGVVTDLLNAKGTAHSALTTARALYTDANYTSENLATLSGFKSDGDAAINAATTLDDVTSAQGVATTGMAGVVTDLLNAKTTAHTALTDALAGYSQANYTAPNWTILNGFKTTGDTNINAAATTDAITTAQTNATDGMAGVIKLTVAQTTPDATTGTATSNSDTPEVVITNPDQAVIVTVGNGTTNPTIDLGSLVSLVDGVKTGTLPAITIDSSVADVSIPDNTIVTGPAGWDEVIDAPTVGTPSGTPPAGFSVGGTVISIGSSDGTLNFNTAVSIVLPGVTGTVGYRPAGSTVWQTITTQCNSATDHSNISSGECYFHDGGNTIILTYHFTTFGSLTVVSSGGNGGGGGGGTYIPPVVTPIVSSKIILGCDARTTGFSTTTGQSCVGNIGTAVSATQTVGQVLGAASFNFTQLMKNGSKGNEVIELQKFLNTLGYTLTADGKFGAKTKAAVIKFQLANNLKGDGVVGPKVRAFLNK